MYRFFLFKKSIFVKKFISVHKIDNVYRLGVSSLEYLVMSQGIKEHQRTMNRAFMNHQIFILPFSFLSF